MEYEEQERNKAGRAARKARERAVREETTRLERKEEWRKRGRSRERRELYDTHWRALLGPSEDSGGLLRLPGIPWPV